MAIKLPDPGNGIPEQKTGNDEWTNMKIVRENFADQSNAASRLVGEGAGNVLPAGAYGLGIKSWFGVAPTELPLYDTRMVSLNKDTAPDLKPYQVFGINFPVAMGGSGASSVVIGTDANDIYLVRRFSPTLSSGIFRISKMYSDKNTDNQNTNGYLKPSSPILKIEADHMWGNDDGEAMGATYTKKGVGDYEISGTTGIRDDGWYIEIPNDINGNPKVAVTLETSDKGVVHLKTYKRVFNMETFKFEPDLATPMDIPEGRWIDLRFNDLPQEELDEPFK